MSTFQQDIVTVRSQNRLLASVPIEEYERIAPYVRSLPVKIKQKIQQYGEPIQHVIFPTGGSCSLVKTLENGQTTEVAMIGPEGAVGAEVFFGQRIAAYDVVVQLPAVSVDAMAADAFTLEMERRGAFFNYIVRYNQALLNRVMQTAACNGLHSAVQRCARWLLMAHERAAGDEFALTHETLATMLGVRRPTVTLVMAELTRTGLVSHVRGSIRILDRRGLESVSCECYRVTTETMRRLLPQLRNVG